jgi:hypothetical protein
LDYAERSPVGRQQYQSPRLDNTITVSVQVHVYGTSRTEEGMEKAVTDRIEQQVRSAFPEGVIARVQLLQYGDDPEVEPGQTAMRVFNGVVVKTGKTSSCDNPPNCALTGSQRMHDHPGLRSPHLHPVHPEQAHPGDHLMR